MIHPSRSAFDVRFCGIVSTDCLDVALKCFTIFAKVVPYACYVCPITGIKISGKIARQLCHTTQVLV